MNVNPTNLAKTNFIASDATLGALAKDYVSGLSTVDGVRGNYLRILVAHSQRELGKWNVKRATVEKSKEAVESAHEHAYGVILEAITTPDIRAAEGLEDDEARRRALERNRRSNFARTAKATLMAWINAGGRLAALKAADVTKEGLRELYAKPPAPRTVQDRIVRAETLLEKLFQQLAKKDIDEARSVLSQVQERLAIILEPVLPKGSKARQLTTKRKQVGELVLHPAH